ncbi:hypothetical protein BMA10247_A2305 [Burkholderia mallei NCTC 10247]|uniref:Uncharacterized protein n=1 Tax=Burkholderia mallei (strain NCTC 10229) TaxID=412022 RepID=A2RZK6_BURM9|nr:hypothetical protein BMA10229_1323 [Burkholderia mallei NCTC 10229]ABO01629.1 hypothetical protein BMA10247_A2305 [Burkholderia mallei NCTC 10247]EDK52861.1 hypothetical protein BMAFMH_G0318 [Burkholderia mallei FMH]EDP87552.1 hypothetical protein BMA10399_B1610 [Burkholderia mallei ATCC 10399]EEC32676.1 conserved hypothetical protein [Burkholderia pseudomallei 576]EEP86283.1 conserved hypothetical protein [Burkholderia mallei GB8 horse 4]
MESSIGGHAGCVTRRTLARGRRNRTASGSITTRRQPERAISFGSRIDRLAPLAAFRPRHFCP